MAFDDKMAERVRNVLAPRSEVEEKRMFGGLCFMVNGRMTVGVEAKRMMVRLSPEEAMTRLTEPFVRPMDFTGRVFRGFLYVDAAGLKTLPSVRKWVNRAVAHADTEASKKGRKHK